MQPLRRFTRLHGSVSDVCLRVCGYCLLHKATVSHPTTYTQHMLPVHFSIDPTTAKQLIFIQMSCAQCLPAAATCFRVRVSALPVGRSALSLHRKFMDSAPPPSPLAAELVLRNDSKCSHSPSKQIKSCCRSTSLADLSRRWQRSIWAYVSYVTR